MERFKALEQLKKEYQEIPIPEQGTDKMKLAMEKAVQKKRLHKRLLGSVAGVAAALLVIAVIPKNGLMMESANKSAGMMHDAMSKDVFFGESSCENGVQSDNADFVASPSSQETARPSQSFGKVVTEEVKDGEMTQEERSENIKEEIRRQIKERSLGGEAAFVRMAASSSLIVLEEKECYYYIKEEDVLVIVFYAGELAPEEYGEIEFQIPSEVWK